MQLYTSSGDEQKPTEVGASQLKSHPWETVISDVLIAGLFTSVFMNTIHIPFTFMFSYLTHDEEYFWEASGHTDSEETALCVQKKVKHHGMSVNLYYFQLIEVGSYSDKEWVFSHNTAAILNSGYSAVSHFAILVI
jgi:hypothetical protein